MTPLIKGMSIVSLISKECQLYHSYHLYHSFTSKENLSKSNVQMHTPNILEHQHSNTNARTQVHVRVVSASELQTSSASRYAGHWGILKRIRKKTRAAVVCNFSQVCHSLSLSVAYSKITQKHRYNLRPRTERETTLCCHLKT